MYLNKSIVFIFLVFFLFGLHGFGQKKLDKLRNHTKFEWITDSIETDIILYFEKDSYAQNHLKNLKESIQFHLRSTKKFIGIESYQKPIHYFVLSDRQRMKMLIGSETNGLANPKNNFVTAIFSEKTNAVTNHELFHLMAMNIWGYPESWINEGMAVYADKTWRGYDLHELSKYLMDNNKNISLNNLSKKLRKYDSMITYPLLGSFAKFIDITYGREIIMVIWTKGHKKIESQMGKTLKDLEQEWKQMLSSVTYQDIDYLKNE